MVSKYAHFTHSDATLIEDMHRVHTELGYINQQAYDDRGRFSHQTQAKRFGSWLKACAAAGVESRSDKGRNPVQIETERRVCLGVGNMHMFDAVKADRSNRICDDCKQRPHAGGWERAIEVADGWEVVAG